MPHILGGGPAAGVDLGLLAQRSRGGVIDALLRNLRMLARYNTLANRSLYEACARLSGGELKRRGPAYIGSIHGALNHLMVGNRIWLARFAGKEVPSTNLDAILYEDARNEAFAAGIDGGSWVERSAT